MAGLRVFVSSTCYDLSLLRSQIRLFIQSLGYEPIMSDYEDVLYDPRKHTHASCISEVKNCDILILIVGGRFGGKASVEALQKIDFEKILSEDNKIEKIKEEGNLSVTQLEVLKAIENGMPVYTFIDKKVWNDHDVYEKNKESGFVDKITFPSIEKQDTAKYIFEFINFVRLRSQGNNIFTFEKSADIEEILKKQWAAYFQQLLSEERYLEREKKKIERLSNQFEDLKTAILSSIENRDQREVARGIVKYRRLFQFVFCLRGIDSSYLERTTDNWEALMKKGQIKDIVDFDEMPVVYSMRYKARFLLLCENGCFYESRVSKDYLENMKYDWEEYIHIPVETRKIIIDALREMSNGLGPLRYINREYQGVDSTQKERQMLFEDVIDMNES